MPDDTMCPDDVVLSENTSKLWMMEFTILRQIEVFLRDAGRETYLNQSTKQ